MDLFVLKGMHCVCWLRSGWNGCIVYRTTIMILVRICSCFPDVARAEGDSVHFDIVL